MLYRLNSGRAKRYKCPCCEYWTLESRGEYDICPVCFWEDEPLQGSEILDEVSEANHGLTLRQGRENYASFGACEKTMLSYVRKPKTDEIEETEGIDYIYE